MQFLARDWYLFESCEMRVLLKLQNSSVVKGQVLFVTIVTLRTELMARGINGEKLNL